MGSRFWRGRGAREKKQKKIIVSATASGSQNHGFPLVFNVSVARGAWAPGRAQGPREAWSLLEGAKTFIFLCCFIVFEAWGSLGNQKTLLFHCFFKVLEGEGREGEKKRKKK